MRFAAFLLFALGSGAFAQSSISVIRLEQVADTDIAIFSPGLTTAWDSGLTGPRSFALSCIADVPQVPGVELKEVSMVAFLRSELQVVALGREAAGTNIGGFITSSFAACGGLCSWGLSDVSSLSGPFDLTLNPLAQGESLNTSFTLYETTVGGSYSPSSFVWPSVLAEPDFRATIGVDSISMWAGRPDGSVAEMQLSLVFLRSTVSVDASATVELGLAASVPVCSATGNSTGQETRLAAYGSLLSGSDWLTVRADRLPANQLAVLLTGTALAPNPAANYTLCVGGAIRREGGNQSSTSTGEVAFDINLLGRIPGQTLYLQVLHRDPLQGIQASDCIQVQVQ